MATELDKLVVKIEADLSNLKKGMAQANKEVQQSSSKFQKSLNKMNDSFTRLGKTTLKYGAIAATAFSALALRGILKSGIAVEELGLRFNLFFGSVEEGQKAFSVLLDFAARVPFALGEIQAGAGSLLAISKNSQELSKNLTIVGNLAASTGLDFATAAAQYQRVASAGAAAADLLRERGVTAQLGFVAGMQYTAEESVRIFEEAFAENGRFAKATNDMAGTLRGVFSQITDSLEKFQQAIASTFIPTLTANFGDLVTTLQKNSDEIKKIGEDIGRTLAEALTFIIENREAIVFAFKAMGAAALAAAANFATFGLAAKVVNMALMLIAKNPAMRTLMALAGVTTILSSDTADLNKEMKELNKQLGITEEKEGLVIKIESGAKEKIQEISQTIKDFKEEVVDIFDQAGKSISDTIAKAVVSGQSFRQSMLDIFQNVISQVLALIIQLTIVDKILKQVRASIEGSEASSFGGVLADAVGGAVKGIGNVLFGRAGGGNVNPNMPYMVGERGAEMFVPKSAGTIVPNNQLSGAGGGNIVIEQNLNFATGVSQTVRAEVMNLLPAIQQSTLSAVQDARLRGGTFAKDFGA
jgi:hypothetical protein